MIKTTIEKHAMLVIDLVDINDYTVGKHAQNNSNKNKDFTILWAQRTNYVLTNFLPFYCSVTSCI